MVSVALERFLSIAGNFDIAIIEISVQLGTIANSLIEFVKNIVSSIDSSISSALSNAWFLGYLKQPLIYYANQTGNALHSVYDNVTKLTSKSQRNLNQTSKVLLADFVLTVAEISDTLNAFNVPQKLMCQYTYSEILQRTSVMNLQNFSTNCVEVYHESLKSGVLYVQDTVQNWWNSTKDLVKNIVNFDLKKIESKVRVRSNLVKFCFNDFFSTSYLALEI